MGDEPQSFCLIAFVMPWEEVLVLTLQLVLLNRVNTREPLEVLCMLFYPKQQVHMTLLRKLAAIGLGRFSDDDFLSCYR